MTTLVPQRTPSDCGICCLAMLTGVPYETVVERVGDAFDPERGMRYEQRALERLGFSSKYENGVPVGDFVHMHRMWAFAPEFFRSYMFGRRALVTVPSLNFEGKWHMVYWSHGKVHDPSVGKTYERLDQLLPQEIILFKEY